MCSVGGSHRRDVVRRRGDTNETPLFLTYIAHLTNVKDSGRRAVWLGWHPVERISTWPNGLLIRVRNPKWSAKAQAGLTEFLISRNADAKAWLSEPLCPP